jgi:hypothetical protein
LAAALIQRLQSRPEATVLDFATGRGRNAGVLRRAGFRVVAISDEAAATEGALSGVTGGFDAALSTHGLLHGTPALVAARVRAIVDRLERGGLFYATFGSTRDARFGRGRRIDEATFAPTEGSERGVAHSFFEREQLIAMLGAVLEVESLELRGVDEIAGAWAHGNRPLEDAAHWFTIAHKR